MKSEKVDIAKVLPNPSNPRTITEDKFQKLVSSVKSFPKMLELRPIVVDDNMVVLGGNMRLKACKEAGLKKVPIIKASELTEEEQREFIIKDNVGFGTWDWELLANEWDETELGEWGLEVWQQPEEVDYSMLDDEDLGDQLDEMQSGVKKAIQIEFNLEDYEKAQELVKFWRDRGGYVGGMLIEFLQKEMQKTQK